MGGLEISHVVSDEGHYSHYVCVICQALIDLDCLVTTACSHAYCRTCLVQWLSRSQPQDKNNSYTINSSRHKREQSSKTCPTCNTDLLFANLPININTAKLRNQPTIMIGSQSVMVQPLELCQPLAYRVLKRIRVACPLQINSAGERCSWQGDYNDLKEHLLSPTAHQSVATAAATAAASSSSSSSHRSTKLPGETSSQHSHNTPPPVPAPTTSSSMHSTVSMRSVTEVSVDEDEQDDENDNINNNDDDQGNHEFFEEGHAGAAPPRASGGGNHKNQDDASPSRGIRQIAESYKEQANAKFANQHYDQARDLYSQALTFLAVKPATDDDHEDDPDQINLELLEATLYSNRAACHYAAKDFVTALADAQKALELDPYYAKAALRVAKSHVQLGQFDDAVEFLQMALVLNPDSAMLQTELTKALELQQHLVNFQAYLANQEYAGAKLEAGILLQSSRAAVVLLANAEADLGLGLIDSASRLATTVIKENPQSIQGYLMRGQASLLSNDMVGGTNLLKQGIRLDPDNSCVGVEGVGVSDQGTAKRWIQLVNRIKQARDDFFHRRFQVCGETLDQVMAACPLLPPKSLLFATLHTERAQAFVRLKKYESAIKECALVLYHQDDYVEAWMTRFSALHGQLRHQDVLEETSDLMQKWGKDNERIRQAWQKADFEWRKANRPDFYELLGICSIASETEIKKAYKQRALDYHPDRFASHRYTDLQRQQAARKFQMLGNALEILTNEFQRQLYDEGYDVEAIRERYEAAQRAAHHKNNPRNGGGGSYLHGHY